MEICYYPPPITSSDRVLEFFCNDIRTDPAGPGVLRFTFSKGADDSQIPKVRILVPVSCIPIARARLTTVLACNASRAFGGSGATLM